MTEKVKNFVATGFRRMTVALVAILTCGVVEFREGSLSKWGAIAIIGVTLGYYSSKLAEVIKELAPSILEWFKSRMGGK